MSDQAIGTVATARLREIVEAAENANTTVRVVVTTTAEGPVVAIRTQLFDGPFVTVDFEGER